MKAVIAERYGGPEVLQIEEIDVPRVGPNGVLVRIHASSVNPIDWKLRNGMLKAVRNFRFPVIWGTDFSGLSFRVLSICLVASLTTYLPRPILLITPLSA